ncbi:MAG: hypothetical protein KF819_05415 [Labilithrix sp.]|nr:hypothetical protein [Labilithrix sp.]
MYRSSPHQAGERGDFWQELLHRWFVQYNPMYLVSATLVLGGMIATSRGLAREGSLYGPLGVALIAELYACALIGGAALLTRIGQRRPAVMLALITVLYQSDLTLHTETCALLGRVGVIAAVAWLALFVGKLYALAWALRIRLARRAIVTAAAGAAGLAAGPYALALLDARMAGGALALFVVALGSLAPRGEDGEQTSATSLVPLDDWGHVVLRRAVKATWVLWSVLLALHVLFWSTQHRIQLAAVVPALALLALRRVRTESRVWLAIASAMIVVGVVAPSAVSMCALLASIALAQRALSPVSLATRRRMLSGAAFAAYLAVWTFGWKGGALPAHVVALDVSLAAAVLLMAWRLRARVAIVPLAATSVHGVVASGLVPPPRTLLEWGATSVALGFLLLAGALATSYRLRHVTPRARE